jgi:3-deoxy-D-manno-octulosonic-acid transferase
MMSALYSFAMWALQPFVRRKLKRRAVVEPLYGEFMGERFGQYPQFEPSSTLVWIHAVSLGETRAAAILLKELRFAIPNMRLLLTNGTATGREEGSKLLQAGDVQVWQPWDTQAATSAFMLHFKPAIGILMETELWPNLIASASRAQIPMLLANARLSEKSFKKSQRWFSKKLARLAYQSLTAVYAQTNDDADRLGKLGATVTAVFGNLKFDHAPSAAQLTQAEAIRSTLAKPVVVFASSREGEEQAFLASLKTFPEDARGKVQWLIVPRHPQRFDAVADLITNAGFAVSRRHSWIDDSIWLGDSLGEMAFYYGLSCAALLGGSFERLGGQNLIEALACGCPVVMGPHTFNFEEAAALAAISRVAFRVDGLTSAIQQGLALGATGGFDKTTAYDFVAKHRGAATKTAQAIVSLI